MTDNFLAEGSLSPLASIRPRRVSNEGIITLSNSAVVSTEDATDYGSEAVCGGFVSLDGTRFVTVGSALYIITTQGFVSILAGQQQHNKKVINYCDFLITKFGQLRFNVHKNKDGR